MYNRVYTCATSYQNIHIHTFVYPGRVPVAAPVPGTCTCTVFLFFLPNFPHIILNLCIHRVHIMQSIIQITTLKLETNSRIQVPGVNRLFYSWSDDRSLSTIPVCVHRYPALPVEKVLRLPPQGVRAKDLHVHP